MIVKYSKKFPYAPYLNEDIGFEMQVDAWGNGIDEEKIIDGLNKLKAIAEKFHKDNNPQLAFDPEFNAPPQTANIYTNSPYQESSQKENFYSQPISRETWKHTDPPTTLKSIDQKAIDRLEILIDDANSEEELMVLVTEIKRFGLEEQYYSKLKKLKPELFQPYMPAGMTAKPPIKST